MPVSPLRPDRPKQTHASSESTLQAETAPRAPGDDLVLGRVGFPPRLVKPLHGLTSAMSCAQRRAPVALVNFALNSVLFTWVRASAAGRSHSCETRSRVFPICVHHNWCSGYILKPVVLTSCISKGRNGFRSEKWLDNRLGFKSSHCGLAWVPAGRHSVSLSVLSGLTGVPSVLCYQGVHSAFHRDMPDLSPAACR